MIMSLTDESTGMVMPVGPMYGNGGFGGGFGGDSWGWIILLLLCANGGFGFGGFGGGMGGLAADGAMLYPWMNQANLTSEGFQNQMLNDSITSIRDGVQGISTQLCNGFASIEQGANTRQMANMQQIFGLQSQLADCCCENRLATCQTQNIVQSESAATRFADANNTSDIVESQTRNTQAILDKLCALELDGYKRENDNLRSQLNMATLRESQTAQNAFIAQGFADEVDQLTTDFQIVLFQAHLYMEEHLYSLATMDAVAETFKEV
jgi:hypothetical protein